MVSKKPIIVTGNKAKALKAYVESKAEKREALRGQTAIDISKLKRVG